MAAAPDSNSSSSSSDSSVPLPQRLLGFVSQLFTPCLQPRAKIPTPPVPVEFQSQRVRVVFEFLIPNLSTLMPKKLEETNLRYHWKFLITNILRANDLMGYVDGSIKCPDKTVTIQHKEISNPSYENWYQEDQAVTALIAATLSDEALTCVYHRETSKEVWDKLHLAYFRPPPPPADEPMDPVPAAVPQSQRVRLVFEVLIPIIHNLVPIKCLDNIHQTHLWEFLITNVLRANDLMGYVDGSFGCPDNSNPSYETWCREDRAVTALICATFTPKALKCVCGCGTSKQLWDKLHKGYFVIPAREEAWALEFEQAINNRAMKRNM